MAKKTWDYVIRDKDKNWQSEGTDYDNKADAIEAATLELHKYPGGHAEIGMRRVVDEVWLEAHIYRAL